MGINYNEIIFGDPIPLMNWSPTVRAGLYAILIPNSRIKPMPYQVVYFGESGNFSERGFPRTHHKYPCWEEKAGTLAHLYIAVYAMPSSTPGQRQEIEQRLINKYLPVCND